MNFLNNIVLHGWCTQNLINRMNFNGKQVLLYLRYPVPANFTQFLHYCLKIFFAFFNCCLKQRDGKARLLILHYKMGARGKGKLGALRPGLSSLFLFFCFASKGWEFCVSLSFNPKSDVQSYFQKVKYFVLLCCCRKFKYSPTEGFLVWTFPPFWEFQFSSILLFGPFCTRRQIGIVFETSEPKIVRWEFLFWKNYLQWKLFTLNRLSLLNGNEKGFTTEKKWLTRKTHFHLFSQFCPVLTRDKFCLWCLWRLSRLGQNL